MSTAIAARIPLVCSHRPPGAPLGERVTHLTAQARQPDGAGQVTVTRWPAPAGARTSSGEVGCSGVILGGARP